MTTKHLKDRVSWAIKFAWDITICKIVKEEIKINKEASLQMHYSSILKTILDLAKFSPDERIDIELESSVFIEGKWYIIDILLTYRIGDSFKEKHSIELKFYKTQSSSGGKRGANDIFMKDIYQDIYYSELYAQHQEVNYTTCLILTDYENFVNPPQKNTKNWEYDTSQGHIVEPKNFTTPIGGKEVNFTLKKRYRFVWENNGSYWATIIRPE